MKPAIEVANLSKRYRLGERVPYKSLRESLARGVRAALGAGGPRPQETGCHWALRDVSFSVAEGEVVGVVGRNGAGKTTLLKVLSRITDPTEGRAVIRGRVASLLEVGTGFHPELTGRENVFLNGTILGMGRREVRARFDEIVAFAEVERFIDTPVKHYSSGMQMRLAFAVAAFLEPEILLVDEVLAVGDAAFQRKCLGKMEDTTRGGRTVVIVSHNIPLIMNLCRTALLLDGGRLRARGPSADVVREYLEGLKAAGGAAAWPDPAAAPGDDQVRLHAVRILQEGIAGPTAEVDIARPVQVEISYWNLRAGSRCYAAIWLRDKLGVDVLASTSSPSMSLTEDGWTDRPRPRGLYRSTCTLPGNFLNEGRYSVTAIVGRPPTNTLAIARDVVSFDVLDTGPMRQEYFGPWLGVVRPRLAWSTDLAAPAPPEAAAAPGP
jgi:lipopolysaccharide transport system ATP-binding protein